VLEVYEGGLGRPSDDLAFERWMLERAAGGVSCACAYSWPGPVVVLGYAQPPQDVDLEWCREHDVPVLRRLTGGTGVVYRGDLAVSLALPVGHPWSRGVVGLYGRFLDVLEPTLRALGSPVRRVLDPQRTARVRSPICFFDHLSDTLLVEGRKAVGCAQTRRAGAVLIHAAVLLGVDVALYAKVFGVPAARVAQGLAPAVEGRHWREVAAALSDGLARALELGARAVPRPPLPDRLRAPYRGQRWAPVGDDTTRN
jgi:lipoate-protein ligase A